MTEIVESLVKKNMAIGEVICRSGKSEDDEGAPVGDFANHDSTRIGGDDVTVDIEQLERKKKTRRRKTKRKNPYSKNGEIRANKQVDSADKTESRPPGRTRDASFTSAESDQDYFYSSPEDEEEFLTKEFSNTYQDLHVESLASMSKTDLIQTVLQLEEKIDSLEKELGHKTGEKIQEKDSYFETEISKLVHVNEELQHENEKLRQQTSQLRTTASSEDSESDSSSSSDSSEMSESEDEQTTFQHMNGDVHSEDDVNMEAENVT